MLAAGSIGLSKAGGHKPCTRLNALRHNLREIQAELGSLGRIDPTRTKWNLVMAGAGTAEEVEALARAELSRVDTSKLKRDHCQAIEIVFSLEAGTAIDTNRYFVDCLEWVKMHMPMPVLSAVVHHDEAHPHAHVVILPVQNGRYMGGASIAKPEVKRLRESFFQRVAGRYGLKREQAKLYGSAKQWAIAAVVGRCEFKGLPVALGPMWLILMAAIERDPLPSMAALGIDVNDIRPKDDESSPIALAASPIALDEETGKIEALSCVGLATPTPSPNLPISPADHGTSATITPATTAPPKKLELARAAMDEVTRPRPKAAPIHDTRGQGYSVDRSDCAPPDWDASPQNWQEGGFDDSHGGELWH